MSSAVEDPSPSTDRAPTAQANEASGTPPAATDEGGFWGAAKGEFDDTAAEKHASKVFALWELGPDLAQPASGASQAGSEAAATEDVWSAVGETEKLDAAAATIEAHRAALAEAAAAHAAAQAAEAAAAASATAAAAASDGIDFAPPAPISTAPVAQTHGRVPSRPRQAARPHEPAPSTVERSPDVTSELPALPQSSSTRNALIGAAAVVALLVVAFGASMMSGSSEPASTAAIAPSAAPAAPAVTTAAAPQAPPTSAVAPTIEPEPVAAPEPVVAAPEPVAAAPEPVVATPEPVAALPPPPPPMRRLRVRTDPERATLLLDGQPVNNPFDGRLPEGSSHTLVARAEGRVDATESVELSADRTLTLRLERTPPPPRVATPRPRTTASRPPRATASRPRPATTVRPRASSSRSGSGFVTESPY
ncbi:hypothetical protein [Sandaracinus amylolyticus]|uniref:hypothetical protein n=1 Tax=Sandaracinus amylolyticus TaxID=927083 RepID=UPI001F1D8EE6|nr:hypothetical protein [Sandaracinus amylolyticus]UJR80293.1 Serine/threonine protein kinase [Sandaracinus amylolyticus]